MAKLQGLTISKRLLMDWLIEHLHLQEFATYGFILLVNYCMNYLDNYPEKKLEHGIYLDFKLLSIRKISTIDYTEYQKIGTGKLIQRIENGSAAGRNVLFNFWLCFDS